MVENSHFFTGRVPVNPEVKLLHDHFGRPSKGDNFPHEDITAVIGEQPKTSRYRSITNTWRRQVFRMYGVVIDAVIGEGFKALDDSESLTFSDKKLKESGRKLRKAADAALTVDDKNISDDEKLVLNHRVGMHAKLIAYYDAEKRRRLVDKLD